MFGLTPFEKNYNSVFDPFGDFDKKFFSAPYAQSVCKTDIRDEGNKYVMEAELPGFDKEDIALDINGDCLTIKAEHKAENETKDKDGKYIRRERSYGSYQRSFDISGVNSDAIAAEYKNGILTVDLPKKAPSAPATRRLQIN